MTQYVPMLKRQTENIKLVLSKICVEGIETPLYQTLRVWGVVMPKIRVNVS